MGLRGVGYWIMLDGTVRQVSTSHVAELLSAPTAFGWTRAGIEVVYARHGERLGLEAQAREELIVATVKRGYVRVREHIGRGHAWNLTIKALDQATLALVAGWIAEIKPAWKTTVPVKAFVVETGEVVVHSALVDLTRPEGRPQW